MAIIGKMDRRVIIQRKTITKDDAAGIVETWQDVCHSWAEKVEESGKEKVTNDSDRADNSVKWRIRFKAIFQGLKAASGFRLLYKSEVFDIHHAKEEGRSNTMLLSTLTTEGIA
jgi:head-tail adaptor